jgi:hypothetical protein
MAAPHVAATALIWSINPLLTNMGQDILIRSVDVIPALDGKCVSNGRLNPQCILDKSEMD